MNSQQKKKSSLILGILSIVLGLLFPIVGLILGIIGLVLAFSYQKESGLDYKTEKFWISLDLWFLYLTGL